MPKVNLLHRIERKDSAFNSLPHKLDRAGKMNEPVSRSGISDETNLILFALSVFICVHP